MNSATDTRKTKGVLLRLGKSDFIELLKKPLPNQISFDEAQRKMQAGYNCCAHSGRVNFKHMPGAINIPLPEIRDAVNNDHKTKYFTVCRTGRRAAAAAFILAQRGFNVMVISSA